MTMTYARKATDKTARELRFLRTFKRTLATHLPETSNPLYPVAPNFRTYRLRPEIVAMIDALRDRYAARKGGLMLTHSEVLAAALSEALPIITAKEEFR